MEDLIKDFVSYSYGSGDGYGSGSCFYNGSGYGRGFGSGYGDYLGGSGAGLGSGSGSSHSYDYDSGFGFGSILGHGFGDGSGDGFDIYIDPKSIVEPPYVQCVINGKPVYLVDNVPTLIDHVRGNIAKGKILLDDLSTRDCYIVKQENYFAHGDTLRDAIEAMDEKQS